MCMLRFTSFYKLIWHNYMYNDNSRKRPRPNDGDKQPPAKRHTPHSSSSGGGEQTVSDSTWQSSSDATPYRARPNDYDRQRARPSSRGGQHSNSGSSQHSSLATILTLSQAENEFKNLKIIQYDKRETTVHKYKLITQQLTNIFEVFNRNIGETEQYVNKRPFDKVSFILYNAGKLIEFINKSKGQFNQPLSKFFSKDTLHSFLAALLSNRNTTSKSIANAIYGLGLIAKAGVHLTLPQNFTHLVKHLPKQNPNAQENANTVYALGRLAQAKIPVTLPQNFTHLVEHLPKQNPNAQNIANTVYALGLLAQAQVKFTLPTNFTELVALLAPNKPNAQEIANTVYALGLLAQAQLNFTLPTNFTELVALLAPTKPDAQEIANTVYALGLLAQAQLNFTLPTNFTKLVTLLADTNPNEQEIANMVYGLERLAAANLLNDVSSININPLITQLVESDFSPRDNRRTAYFLLYNLRSLLGQNLFNDIAIIKDALMTVCTTYMQPIKALKVFPLFTQLERYAEDECINKSFSFIVNSLAHPHFLEESLKTQLMAILNKFTAGSSFHKILLASKFKEYITASARYSPSAETMTREQMTREHTFFLEPHHTSSPCSSPARSPSPLRDSEPVFTQILACAPGLTSRPAPTTAGLNDRSGQLTQTPIAAGTQALTPRLPPERESSTSSRSRASGRPQEGRQAVRQRLGQLNQNRIFQLIATENIRDLLRLLNLKDNALQQLTTAHRGTHTAHSGRRSTTPHHASSHTTHTDTHEENDILVSEFFNLPLSHLKTLIKHSSAHGFMLLLKSCSAHCRYTLTRQTRLHPVFI